MDKLRCGGIKKHIVIKCDDAEKALSKKGTIRLMSVLDTIEEYREEIGKSIDNEYLVINTDEPYAGEIIEILKRNGHWG